MRVGCRKVPDFRKEAQVENTKSLAREEIPKRPQNFPTVGDVLSVVREGIPEIPTIPTIFNDGESRAQVQRMSKSEALEDRLLAVAEAYEERAAILEFDAGLSREEAERLAREMTGYHGW